MSATGVTGLTYADLLGYPHDDNVRRELIDGELFVSPSPLVLHQLVVGRLTTLLTQYASERGGTMLPGPTDVVMSDTTVVVPDASYFTTEHQHRIGLTSVGPPDLVVEVSSPSTRRTDLIRKRAIFEAAGVSEYWFVDLEQSAVVVHRGATGTYEVTTVAAGQILTSPLLPGLTIAVDYLLQSPFA